MLNVPEDGELEKVAVAYAVGAHNTLSNLTEHRQFTLHFGNSKKALVRIVPDSKWPGMWRMVWPDGSMSDMGNLARIKDAAAVICQRGPPQLNGERFHWKKRTTAAVFKQAAE